MSFAYDQLEVRQVRLVDQQRVLGRQAFVRLGVLEELVGRPQRVGQLALQVEPQHQVQVLLDVDERVQQQNVRFLVRRDVCQLDLLADHFVQSRQVDDYHREPVVLLVDRQQDELLLEELHSFVPLGGHRVLPSLAFSAPAPS